MKRKLSEGHMAALIVAICLIIDQVIKLSVKLNMRLYESIHVTDWFYIYFTENPGMAFGMEIFGKIFLTLFRIIAVGCFVYYLCKIRDKGFPRGYIACVALIIAGAAGNIFDCIFYGPLFSESTPYTISEMVSWGDGYAPILKGRVVDMFYFPLVEWNWPDWIPFIGGEHFIFFSPIFNFADACISCAVIAILFFYSKCMNWGLEGPNHALDEKETSK